MRRVPLFSMIVLIAILTCALQADPNMVAHYPFDGDPCDASGGGRHGTVYGATLTTDHLGNPDSAYQFDGNAYIRVSGFAFTASEFSVALWLYADWLNPANCSPFAIHSGGDGGHDGDQHISLWHRYEQVLRGSFSQSNGATVAGHPSAAGITANKWYHVVYLRQGKLQKLYINGVAAGDTYQDDLVSYIQNDSGLLDIGAPNYKFGGWDTPYRSASKWRGKIDDLRVYRKALTEAEILALIPPVIVSPQGSEQWVAGNEHLIRWDGTAETDPNVILEFSDDNGQSWTDIAETENDGQYLWTPPAINSTECLIRITGAVNQDYTHTLDAPFTIYTCSMEIAGDVNRDCYVNLLDVAAFADDFLECSYLPDPNCTQP